MHRLSFENGKIVNFSRDSLNSSQNRNALRNKLSLGTKQSYIQLSYTFSVSTNRDQEMVLKMNLKSYHTVIPGLDCCTAYILYYTIDSGSSSTIGINGLKQKWRQTDHWAIALA